MRVLVLGGTGFIGRHAAAALLARGHEVCIGTRHPARAPGRLPSALGGCGLREIHMERLANRGDWHVPIAGFHAVVNAVGILRERGAETYERVHHRAAGALAAACALGGRRLIHVSALGLHERARSRFLQSKLAGERAIASSAGPYSIVRPSLLDGEGGFGARWLRWFARQPVHFVPEDALGRIAVLDVADLGEAVALLCELPAGPQWREVELGGDVAPTMRGLLAALRSRYTSGRAWVIGVPHWLARLVSHLCDLAHFSPFSYGHLELLGRDNVPRPNLLPKLLGRESSPLTLVGRRAKVVQQTPVALGRTALERGRGLGAPTA
jgi:NADH dehydrogenase